MTIYEVIDNLEKIAKTQPLIGSTGEGDIYEYMNADPSVKYATFFITQGQHTETEMFDNYNLTLFYIDRLTDNEDNRVEIQSIGKETLSNIIRTFKDIFDAESENINYQPFTQRFNDSCAGVFASLSIEVEKNSVCGEEYQYAVNPTVPEIVIKNQKKSITIEENGKTTVSYDSGYTGLESVQIDVNVPEKKIQPIKYFSVSENSIWGFGPDKGYDGVAEIEVDVNVPTPVFKTEQKTVSVVENGQTIVEKSTDKDGMTKVIVNVDVPEKTFTTEELTANENGVYTPSADGYSKVTVNVPQEEFKTEEKTVSIVNNGQTVIDKSVEADGMTRVTVDVNVPEKTFTTEELIATENRVYTPTKDGYSKVTVNVPEKEFKTQAKTVETNGTVRPDNGFDGLSEVTVNVPQTGGGNIDLTGTGWLSEPVFPVDVTRIGTIKEDLDITRERFSKWKPGITSAKNFYFEKYDTPNEMIYAPKINTEGVLDMEGMFLSCKKLSVMSAIDTSSVTNMKSMFAICDKLIYVPFLETKNVTNMNNMFQECDKLITIPALNTEKVETVSMMFYRCFHLERIPELDFTNVKDALRLTGVDYKLDALSKIGGFKNLKVSMDLSNCEHITRESGLNIINDLAQADPAFEAQPKLAFNHWIDLREEDIAIATSKGWTVLEV